MIDDIIAWVRSRTDLHVRRNTVDSDLIELGRSRFNFGQAYYNEETLAGKVFDLLGDEDAEDFLIWLEFC